ncbi:hypothetical protein cypCar_00010566 [Cyprinus carpio]|nr:hypothetical protein cypCar_00010566 [Cyprinus carpio]
MSFLGRLAPRFWLILLLTVATGWYGAKIGHQEQDNSPKVTPLSDDFDDLFVIELDSKDTNISFKTIVVVTKCECH